MQAVDFTQVTQNTVQSQIEGLFQKQTSNQLVVKTSSADERIAKLKRLRDVVLSKSSEIKTALYLDFKKPEAEVIISELLPFHLEINHTIKHLRSWMKPKRAATPLVLFGTSSRIRYEAKGVCLLISPWNFPFNLTFCPLVSAIAAGNCVIIKPSEHSPSISQVMQEIVEAVFAPDEIAVIQGEASVASALLKLPFHHIFFTGSPKIGKIVMKAAAEHLTSVTLELGGKSPVIVDETADLDNTASKIVWTKLLNCGQTCIAPDYLYVHERRYDELVAKIKNKVSQFYGESDENRSKSESFARIVNENNHRRLVDILNDAITKGATTLMGGLSNAQDKYLAPTLVTGVDSDMRIMQEELFGPVLPILKYKKIDEVVQYINQNEKPLALYIFSSSKANKDYILQNTTSGSVAINDAAIQFMNLNTPFGGVNNSGIGQSHGLFGFKEFSHAKTVLTQHWFNNLYQFLMPPYKIERVKLIEKLYRYL